MIDKFSYSFNERNLFYYDFFLLLCCLSVESSNFLTECFFLTQRALHVGLMTTITHFERLLRYTVEQ